MEIVRCSLDSGHFYAPINVKPVGGGGVRTRGGDLTKK